jgi:hypothetical protein
MSNEYVDLDPDEELAIDMGELADDPYEWVKYAFDWGNGALSGFDGPDVWQAGFLKDWRDEIRLRGFNGHDPVMPYRTSTTSGHGIGKSALTGMIAGFILSTRPHSKGRVSANSIPQLQTTTWMEIAKWTKLMITSHWFRVTSGKGALKIVHKDYDDWRIDGLAWDASRPAAFAGLHAKTSSPWYLFDEASEISQNILETAQGALTDGEPFFFMFSNPTATSGYFFESHHEMRHRFKTYQIDSRTAKTPNKALIKEWIDDYGLDSDYVKVRVLGEFPMTGDSQFLPGALVDAAFDEARVANFTPNDPVILGVDVARYGGDECAIYIRRGRDVRTHPAKFFREIDTNQLALRIKEIADELLPDAINIDGGAMGPGVIDNLKAWGVPNVNEIHFGGTSPDAQYDDMATYMMGQAREWLKGGNACLPPEDKILRRQLKSREYKMIQGKNGTKVKIESKEELKAKADKGLGKESPDRADGFVLTFAVPVAIRDIAATRAEMSGTQTQGVVDADYDRI